MNLFQALASNLITRSTLASVLFGGRRDLYRALGYSRNLTIQDYRQRYERNEVAARVVEAFPIDTWRGGGELVEDEDPETETEFEHAWAQLDKRLHLWTYMQRGDIVAGIGRYGVLMLGAPGDVTSPLVSCPPDQLKYVRPYGEDDCKVEKLVSEEKDERFGLPEFYSLTRTTVQAGGAVSKNSAKRVHHSRIIHLADNVLDDSVYGRPRLERIWNRLDDLEKVAGGGSEAFWKRADQGKQFDLDPTMDLSEDELIRMQQEVDKYVHDNERIMRTRGMKITSLGSDVANFGQSVDSIIGLISAGTGIPQRILMGSERGQLASTQDRSNWDERVSARRQSFAEPFIVRALVDRLIALKTLPEPQDEYRVEWSQLNALDDTQRADLASKWASLNTTAGVTVVTPDEIRTRGLGFGPLADVVDETHQNEPAVVKALEAMVDAITADKSTVPTTVIQMPARTSRRIVRDATGLMTGIVEEPNA